MNIKQSDWNIFCEIKSQAFEQYCDQALNGVIERITDKSASAVDRFEFMREKTNETQAFIMRTFDGHSRSQAFTQLMLMCEAKLVAPEQFERLSDEMKTQIRDIIEHRAQWFD